MVNVTHIHRKIEQFFCDGRRSAAQIGYAYDEAQAQGAIIPKPFGSVGGLGGIQDFSRFFSEATLVRCGDLNIGAALHENKTTGAIANDVTPGGPLADVQSYGIVVIEGNGQNRGQINADQHGHLHSNTPIAANMFFYRQDRRVQVLR